MPATFTFTSAQGRSETRHLTRLLSADVRERTRVEANRWIKSLRLAPYSAGPMRSQFTYRGDSLWWFTELYLHKMRRLDLAVGVVLALDAACDAESPVALSVEATDPVIRAAAKALAARRGLPCTVNGAPDPVRRSDWKSFQIGLTARLSRLRGPVRIERRPRVAAFVHTAFWRPTAGPDGLQQENYIGAVLDALSAAAGEEELFCVGVGPRRNFRSRRWWDALGGVSYSRLITPVERLSSHEALAGSMSVWRTRDDLARQVVSGDGIRDAARFRGCDLWPILQPELEDVARLQWPWSARAMDEAGAAFDALEPGAMVTYAEAGGWGRALVLEARRRRIPSIGLQHGFIYRHWLNYLHEPDEMAAAGDDLGCPIPDRTLVFDRFASGHLVGAGHYPADAVEVSGNARLDQLVERCASLRPLRDALRRELTGDSNPAIALLAAKFSEVRDVLPDLVEAMRRLPEARLVIKPHPAETPDVYAAATLGVSSITTAETTTDLARLIVAADVLVTMNSTVAIDGLVVGLPAVVIGLPNNLTPFVDAGAMRGAEGPAGIAQELRAVLYDAEVRRAIVAAGSAFAREHALASDGRAARRSAESILALAGGPGRSRQAPA